ncbi:site-specific integrase [Tropicimonas sp. TH_r6]|uniref:tyrosine-type recombinase/integrase n=1 Tax=Tropicimonas sp. TH_r6 TaxID=3082085 RepID=UPI002954CB90|nr:site-specific integrase [Tropicimonas sp. TH_r6]MDV7143034.1 site-specific integrase [Tropicimonas sp. TH_r6]
MHPINQVVRRRRTSPPQLKGETAFAIYRSDNSPAIFPWMWTVSEARSRRYTPDGIATMLTHIKVLELWAIHRKIDLYPVMILGECLSLAEIRDFEPFLSYRLVDLREVCEMLPCGKEAFLERCLKERAVENGTIVQRKVTILAYLSWLGEFGNRLIKLRRTGNSELTQLSSAEIDEIIVRRSRLLEPSVPLGGRRGRSRTVPGSYAHLFSKSRVPQKKSNIKAGIKTDDVHRFFRWLVACDPTELGKDPWVARRNYVILNVLVELGARAGELLQMKVEDYKSQYARLDVVRRHNDPDCPRLREPVGKTLDRPVKLSDFLVELVHDWLDHREDIDAETPKELRNPFLFPSLNRNPGYRGKPLTKSGLDYILRKAANAAGIEKMTAHPLRHRQVQEKVKLLKERGASHEERRKALVFLFGWSDNSEMIQRYLGSASELGAVKSMRTIWAEREVISDKLDELFISTQDADRPEHVELLEKKLKLLDAQAKARR